MVTCCKKLCFSFLLILFGMSLWACSDRLSYDHGDYTEDDVRMLFRDNRELFARLVEVIVNEPDFFEKGRRYESDDAFLSSPYDKKLDLFSENGRETVLEFFELKPYMIIFDASKECIEIEFVIEKNTDVVVFSYWLGSGAAVENGGNRDLKGYILKMESIWDIEDLGENWFFCTSKEPENSTPTESQSGNEADG